MMTDVRNHYRPPPSPAKPARAPGVYHRVRRAVMGNKTRTLIFFLIPLASFWLWSNGGFWSGDGTGRHRARNTPPVRYWCDSGEPTLDDQLHGEFSKGDARYASVNFQPQFRGKSELCRSRTRPINCRPDDTACIKISAVGLCGGWSKSVRKLPADIKCPALKGTRVVLEHTDKPEYISDSAIVLVTFQATYLNMEVWLSLRRHRPPGQMWVLQTEESPVYTVGPTPPWVLREDTYNISNSYRRGADIYSPYGYYEPFRGEESNKVTNISNFLEKKTKPGMVWVSSHCETLQYDRTKFVKDLREVMDVDIFGKCGNDTLCKKTWDGGCTKELDDLVGSYKFYLAIENSCCEDYITEKLWHAYFIGTVPVVLGPRIQNYEKLAPPRSFIHLDQFKSVQEVREYLYYLDKNLTAYLEYFEWRTKGTVREHTIKEHYKNHLSDGVLCSVVEQYLARMKSPEARAKMFDPYGEEWMGTCHSCGENRWIRDYEYTMEHKRKSKWIWAR